MSFRTPEHSPTRDPSEDRPIRASGSYDLSVLEEIGSELANRDEEELTQIVGAYVQQLQHNEMRDSVSTDDGPRDAVVDQTTACRNRCIQTMGAVLFEEIYAFMKRHQQRNTPYAKIKEEAEARWGKRNAMNYCFLAEQLLFAEGFN